MKNNPDFLSGLTIAVNMIRRFLWIFILLVLLTQSTISQVDSAERVRRYSRMQEFEFAGWTLNALGSKFEQFSLGSQFRIAEDEQKKLVMDYFQDLGELRTIENQVEQGIAHPDPLDASQLEVLQGEWRSLRDDMDARQPLIEGVLEAQISSTLVDLGMGTAGRIIPPVTFKFTPLPLALIVSPRDVILQENNIQLDAGLSLEEMIAIEEQIENDLDVAALIVPIGGIGIYPTMVLETPSHAWVVDTISHEWVHNYLTLRLLGLNYETSPELRTMNETTASILGREIGLDVIELFYPELLPPPAPEPESSPPLENTSPPAFDFRAEMHATRVRADSLLAEGNIEEAEEFMEFRRLVFWENGYQIRKLNQAYFAFYGAYADTERGAAGEDPIGAAVRDLWAEIQSPAEFLRTMSWMNSVSDLEQALGRQITTR
jgi:hypothetical protein